MSKNPQASGNVVAIGTDIVECSRIASMIEKHGDLFLSRVYTEREVEYARARASMIQHFAGRWAAKEAVLKVFGTGWSQGIQWSEIEVQNDEHGRPMIELSGRAFEVCQQLGIHEVLISISHCATYAIAFATGVRST